MIKRVFAVFFLTLFFLFSGPVYSLDIPVNNLEKYTKKISKKFTIKIKISHRKVKELNFFVDYVDIYFN